MASTKGAVGAPRRPRLDRAPVNGRKGHPSGNARVGSVLPLQRRRILAAAVELIDRQGLAFTSIGGVCARAGVSRRTFYEVFADRDECLAAAFEDAVERAAVVVVPAFEGKRRWRERVRDGLGALLGFLDAEPALARLLVVEALAGGPLVLSARARVVGQLIEVVEEGREEARTDAGAPELAAEGVVGAVIAIVHARMLTVRPGSSPTLIGLTSQLMGIVALPYLGPAAAAREGLVPVSVVPRLPSVSHAGEDPFKDLPMRLTYRTALVLSSIAAAPGASSKQVADTAGIADQGQISRLLGRLERLGLVHNGGPPPGRGEAKAWTLTERGQGVVATIGSG